MKVRFSFSIKVTIVAFVFYLATLNWDITVNSLPFAIKITGWDWQPMTGRPLAWLLTLPIRLLPVTWIPIALNLFSALTAALTLGILARSVQILRWDCPPLPGSVLSLRLPAILACALCGLEFHFWQDATAMTGEVLEILIFAAALVCLLEFRLDKNARWLDLAAVIWGIGLAENWAMQLLFPVFVIMLWWLPGWKKVGRPFFKRLAILAIVGGILFSLQPLANSCLPHAPMSFSEAWGAALATLKNTARTLYFGFWSWHRLLTVTVLLYFLVPILACVVRIKNEAANNVYGVERIQIWIFRITRVGLLFACLWLAFDPEVGPRKTILTQFKVALPLLTFDYLLALGAAFLLGSLLYAAQNTAPQRNFSSLQKFSDFLRQRALMLLTALAVLVIAAHGWRSAVGIRQAHQATLADCGELLTHSLPAEGGIILANDPMLLMTAQAAIARNRAEQHWTLVDLQSLPLAKYRVALENKSSWGWTSTNSTTELTPSLCLQLLQQLSATHHLFYLLPAPGHFLFEQFYPATMGGTHELKNLADNSFDAPPLTTNEIVANETFWDAAWEKHLARVSQINTRAAKNSPRHLALTAVKPEQAQQFGRWFSMAINNWGVELQRNGKLMEARHRFEQAQLLNPENSAASINLHCNSNLVMNLPMDLSGAPALAKNIASIQQLARIVEVSGNYDEAVVCALLGDACYNAGWPRQALQQLNRAKTLAPDSVAPELAMAKIYSRFGMAGKVLDYTKHLRQYETNAAAGHALGLELSLLEAKSWFDLTNSAAASRVLENVLEQNPDDASTWETVFKAYIAFGAPTNALTMLNHLLAKDPDSIPALNNQAAVLVQLQRAAEALPILDRVLTLTNLPSIRLNRAIALLQAQHLAEAETAYEELQTAKVDQVAVHFGLAQIAENRHATNAAIKAYSFCLANTAPKSTKWQEIQTRLNVLQKN